MRAFLRGRVPGIEVCLCKPYILGSNIVLPPAARRTFLGGLSLETMKKALITGIDKMAHVWLSYC